MACLVNDGASFDTLEVLVVASIVERKNLRPNGHCVNKFFYFWSYLAGIDIVPNS